MYAGLCGGEKTTTGYKWHYGVGGKVTDKNRIDVRKLDYFGFNMTVCDNDSKPKRGTSFFKAMDVKANDQMKRLNLLMIVDRKGVFPGIETTNLHLFQ